MSGIPPWRWLWAACAAGGFGAGWTLFADRQGEARGSATGGITVAGGTASQAPVGGSPAPTAPAPALPNPGSPILDEWKALVQQAGGLSPRTMPALYVAVNKIEDDWRRRALRAALVEEWIEQDAPGAFARAYETAGPSERFVQVPEAWIAHDPEAAIEAILKRPETMAGGLVDSLLPQLIGMRPDLVARFVNGLSEGTGMSSSSPREWNSSIGSLVSGEPVVAAFAGLAAKDPGQMRTLLDQLKGEVREQALLGLARTLGESDPTQALAWAQALQSPKERDLARMEVLGRWAEQDPFTAAGHLAGIAKEAPPSRPELMPGGGMLMRRGGRIVIEGAGDDASDALERAVTLMASRDLPRTVDWLSERAGDDLPDRLLMLPALQLAATDPAGAVALLGRIGDEDARVEAFGDLLDVDGPLRPEAWRDWLEARPADGVHDALRAQLAATWAEADPDGARQWVEAFPEGTVKDSMRVHIMEAMLERGASGADDAQKYFDLAPASARPALAETLLDQDADEIDPARLTPLLSYIGDDERRQELLGDLVEGWTKLDPRAAITWSDQLDDPESRIAALSHLAGAWATADSFEASEWAASLPPGEVRDAAAFSLAAQIGEDSPQEALEWAASIGHTSARAEAVAQVLMPLRERDPVLAERLLNESKLSDADAEAVVRLISAADEASRQQLSE